MKETGKRKNGKGLIPAIALCVLLLSACGGSEGKDAETVPEQSSAVQSQQTAPEASESETGSKAEESETGGTEDAASAVNGTSEEGTAQAAEANTDAKQSEAAPVTDNQTAASGVELNGSIEEIGEGSFKVSEIITQDLGDEGLLAVGGNSDPADYIEVRYTDETVFTIRSSSDRGITYSDSAGTAKDIKTETSMVATGRRDGNIFHAQSIMIFHFE